MQLTIRPVHLLESPGVESGTNYLQITADPLPNAPGKYEATYVARDAGAYSVQAVVTEFDGKVAGRAMAGWASDPAAEEFRVLKPNRELLAAIAQKTGGVVLTMSALRSFRPPRAGTARADYGNMERSALAQAHCVVVCHRMFRDRMGNSPVERIAVKAALLSILAVVVLRELPARPGDFAGADQRTTHVGPGHRRFWRTEVWRGVFGVG